MQERSSKYSAVPKVLFCSVCHAEPKREDLDHGKASRFDHGRSDRHWSHHCRRLRCGRRRIVVSGRRDAAGKALETELRASVPKRLSSRPMSAMKRKSAASSMRPSPDSAARRRHQQRPTGNVVQMGSKAFGQNQLNSPNWSLQDLPRGGPTSWTSPPISFAQQFTAKPAVSVAVAGIEFWYQSRYRSIWIFGGSRGYHRNRLQGHYS